jgi:hypothetical protein
MLRVGVFNGQALSEKDFMRWKITSIFKIKGKMEIIQGFFYYRPMEAYEVEKNLMIMV